MDRREFMKACGLVPAGGYGYHGVVALWATNTTFTEPARKYHQGDMTEITGEGAWWIRKCGNGLAVRLYCDDFYCDFRIMNFAENVDWVRAFTVRDHESPQFMQFANMFGFGE